MRIFADKMKTSLQSELIIVLLSLVQAGFSEGGTRVKIPLKRSYQLPQVAVVNNPQALQYYAAAPLYTIPTVLIPNQLSLSASPIANVVIPPSTEPKPTQEFQETSTPVYQSQKTVKIPASHYYKPKHYRHPVYVQTKRPTSYVNSVYGVPVRMKPLSSVSPHKSKVSASVSIQPSVDLSAQYNQEAASDLYPTTVGPPAVSTYGPPKTVDFQYKTRPAGQSPVYHKLKGPSHRHAYYPSKKMRVYSHVHKDHVHNHYIPAGHSFPVYKSQQPLKYSAPAYLPPVTPTPETAPVYPSYQTNGHIRFPENQEQGEPQEQHKPNYSHSDVTQAIIKGQGVINNYDANIPLHVPSKKPYQFEVNDILKNSELHFVQEAEKNNEQENGYNQKVQYQNGLMLGGHQPLYAPLTLDQTILSNPLDIYNLPGVNGYQSNHIVGDQDLGTSETVKVPVAVIRGAHNIAGQGMFGFVKRQDEANTQREETKKAFTPSKRTSDWIPMSGNGVPLPSEKQSDVNLETFAEEYQPPARKETVKTVRQPVGDIISGKIPEKYSPKGEGDVVNGDVGFLRSSPGGRKGSVIDVYPSSASSEVVNGSETSDLVVSSVIKFS